MLRKILVPTDFSEASMSALQCARGLAQSTNAELIVLHVLEFPNMAMGDVPYYSMNVASEIERSERGRLSNIVEDLRTGSVCARGVFHIGMASATILELAEGERPDLIVIGTHGRSAISRVILGSVVERVVRSSPAPVLTVRGAAIHTPPADSQYVS